MARRLKAGSRQARDHFDFIVLPAAKQPQCDVFFELKQ
jgi:hypothetical protein